MSFLLIRPYAELIPAENQLFTFYAHAVKMNPGSDGLEIYKFTIPVLSLVLITSLLSFICIFLYHRRIIQIRLCLVNIFLLLALLLIMFIYYSAIKNSVDPIRHSFKIPAIFPFMSILFTLMAYKAIHRDELLVDSFNRIR
jgi:glucan phosphoethanolaminetransferase (alkaline phosphatase superfamily)